MSNVLIGIIGVILFIGLALAGALFLGPRFQEATNNSKASAAVQAVSQIASAANMQNVQTGTPVDASFGVSNLVSAGYLRSVPSNPVVAALPAAITDANGSDNAGVKAVVAVMSLGPNSRTVCDAIIRQTCNGSSSTAVALTYSAATDGITGCKKSIGSNGSANITANDYVVYAGF